MLPDIRKPIHPSELNLEALEKAIELEIKADKVGLFTDDMVLRSEFKPLGKLEEQVPYSSITIRDKTKYGFTFRPLDGSKKEEIRPKVLDIAITYGISVRDIAIHNVTNKKIAEDIIKKYAENTYPYAYRRFKGELIEYGFFCLVPIVVLFVSFMLYLITAWVFRGFKTSS